MTLSHHSTHMETAALGSLRRRWGMVVLLYAVTWWLTYQLLQSFWFDTLASRWRLGSAGVALLLLTLLWRGLRYNRHTESSRLWPTLGYGNWLSIVRGILLCLLAGFLFLPRPTIALTWLPALLYTADRITDLFDGYLARITQRESKLGAMLDIELDGLGLLVAVVLGVQYGLLPAWYLILAVSRQLFVAGMWLRKRAGLPNRDLPPSDNRRVIAGFQTGFLSVMFWPILVPAVTHLAAILFAIPLIYSFGRDWLVVSHAIDPEAPAYNRVRGGIKSLFESWLPVVARLVAFALFAQLLWSRWQDEALWDVFVVAWSLPTSPWLHIGTIGLAMVAAIFVVTGYLARVAALLLMTFALLLVSVEGLSWQSSGALFVSSVIVAHLGSGRWSYWQPEERWLHTQYGKVS
ncbi:MAG: CDP-alcohol phosphatidyltransferase family protein [Caldilineaceae bacterium]